MIEPFELPIQQIGSFAAGEIPPPVIHQFIDRAGDPLPLTGFTATAFIHVNPAGTEAAAGGTVEIIDFDDALVRYTWAASDMATPASYRLQIWVENAGDTERYASDMFAYEVYDGIGPTIP